MIKTIGISTIFAAAALQAAADPITGYDLSILPADVAAQVAQLQQYGDRFEPAIIAIFTEHAKPTFSAAPKSFDLSVLPATVAAHVAMLQKHGDRFEPVIRAIFVQHAKPSYGFDSCAGENGDLVLSHAASR